MSHVIVVAVGPLDDQTYAAWRNNARASKFIISKIVTDDDGQTPAVMGAIDNEKPTVPDPTTRHDVHPPYALPPRVMKQIEEKKVLKAQSRYWTAFFRGDPQAQAMSEQMAYFNYSPERYARDKVTIDGMHYWFDYWWREEHGSQQGVSCTGEIWDTVLNRGLRFTARCFQEAKDRGLGNDSGFTREQWKNVVMTVEQLDKELAQWDS